MQVGEKTSKTEVIAGRVVELILTDLEPAAAQLFSKENETDGNERLKALWGILDRAGDRWFEARKYQNKTQTSRGLHASNNASAYDNTLQVDGFWLYGKTMVSGYMASQWFLVIWQVNVFRLYKSMNVELKTKSKIHY